MNERDQIQKELRELGSGLTALGNEEPFKPPQDYFSKLPGEVQEKLSHRKTIFPGLSTAGLVFRATASLAILMLVVYLVMLPLKKQDQRNNQFSNLENYLIENIDESTLIEFYNNEQLQDYESNSMEEYLLENLDEKTLIDEL